MNKLCVLFIVAVFAYEVFGQNPGLNLRRNRVRQTQKPKPTTPSTTTVADGSTSSTTLSPEVVQCIRDCPVTPEYNPVCGTNNVTYNNPGSLACAQWCGVEVSLKRPGRCPSPSEAD